MSKVVDISVLLRSIVENFTTKVKFDAITETEGIYTVETTCTSYIFKNLQITVNGQDAIVKSLTQDVNFTFKLVTGSILVEDITEIVIKPFKYYYGTVIKTKEELDASSISFEKLPLVWLYSIYDQTIISRRVSQVNYNSESSIRVFILGETNYTDYLTEDHEREVIRPIIEYYESLIREIEKNKLVFEVGNITLRRHSNWGQYRENGHIEKIFTDDLSGIELTIPLTLNENKECKC